MSIAGLGASVDPRMLRGSEGNQRWHGMQPPIGSAVNLVLTSGTAYWAFCNRLPYARTIKFVRCFCASAGAGGQTAEVALAYSLTPPNTGNQTLIKLAATGTVDSFTAGIPKVVGNTAAFSVVVPPDVYLWAGLRTAMATTQPTMNAFSRDYARGTLLTTAASGALTGAGPWTGAVIAATTSTNECPVLWASED